jgi:vacuolar-type H+-ATPase subunit H|tara:strand:- start:35 stop:229 length:195 start_codon:yes stop_codon:yes gene_type:complete
MSNFEGTIDDLLEHVTENQDKLVEDAKKTDLEMLTELLEEMVDEGHLSKKKINGETFYSNPEEE